MNKLSHPAVIRCFPVPTQLESLQGDLPMICMEYCSGGDLRKVIISLYFILIEMKMCYFLEGYQLFKFVLILRLRNLINLEFFDYRF